MNDDNVIVLAAHDRMSVEQCLASAVRDQGNWESVMVIAGDKDGNLIIRSSGMSRKDALWMSMMASENALGR